MFLCPRNVREELHQGLSPIYSHGCVSIGGKSYWSCHSFESVNYLGLKFEPMEIDEFYNRRLWKMR